MNSTPILGVRIGKLAPLGPRGAPSGIRKSEAARPVELTDVGFMGDMQGDVRHGGAEKAIHHYPFDHYISWTRQLGPIALLQEPGAFGENLSTVGLTENDIAIGDVFAVGTAVIEVSQGRQPCWRLNERFGLKTMARQVQETGMTGWYYRVRQTGVVGLHDRLKLLDRRSPDWRIDRIWRAFYVDPLNRNELEGIANLERLASGWRSLAIRRLESGRVEDWAARLGG